MRKAKDRDKNRNPGEELTEKVARLGPSLLFRGEISGEEDLVIKGQFQGKIDLKNHDLVVEQGAKVEAEIRVKNITINGDVNGNVCASKRVFISKEGQMKGDITASRISIMDGAQFKGSIKMEAEKEKG